jgi:hypothetical protein
VYRQRVADELIGHIETCLANPPVSVLLSPQPGVRHPATIIF